MTKCTLITQSHTKRQTAQAIAEAKTRRQWSNGDAGDALGIGEGTIRNRLDGDDPKHQMTVHELLRSIQADGPHIANSILRLVDHRAHPIACESAPDAIGAAGNAARCAAELIAAAGGRSMTRTCSDCPSPVTKASKTGRCRPCAAKANHRDPAFRARLEAGARANAARPEHRAKMKAAARRKHAERAGDPAWEAYKRASGKRLRAQFDASPAAQAANLAKRALVGEKNRMRRLGWLPDRLRRQYESLRTNRGAAEAKRIVMAELTPFERQMARIFAGAQLVAAPDFRTGGPEYNDPNFAATVTNQIALKFDKAGGALGGDVDHQGHRVTGLPSPTSDDQPARLAEIKVEQAARDTAIAAAIAALINGAPGALDTLKELADAFGDDPNFAATVTNAIALKFGKAGGVIDGDVGLSGHHIYDLADPSSPQDASTKAYVDARDIVLSGNISDRADESVARDQAEQDGRVEADNILNDRLVETETLLSLSGDIMIYDDAKLYRPTRGFLLPISVGGFVADIFLPLTAINVGPATNSAQPMSDHPNYCWLGRSNSTTAQALILNMVVLTYQIVEFDQLRPLMDANPGKIIVLANWWGDTVVTKFAFHRTSYQMLEASAAEMETGANRTRTVTPFAAAEQRNTWQVSFFDGGGPQIDPVAAVVRYPRFLLMREGYPYKLVDPALYGLMTFDVSLKLDGNHQFHYVDLTKVGSSAAVPLLTMNNAEVKAQRLDVVPMGYTVSGLYHSPWADAVWTDRQPSARLSFSGASAIYDDAYVYSPDRAFYMPIAGTIYSALSKVTLGNPTNAAAAEMPTHCKLVRGTGATAQALVLDLATVTYSIVDHPNLPNVMAAKPGKIFVLANWWGDTVETTIDFDRTSRMATVMPVSAAKPLIGRELFLVSDRALPIYLENMLPARGRGCPRVSITSIKGGTTSPLAIEQEGGCAMIDPARTGSAVTLTVASDQVGNRHVSNMVASVKSVPVTGSPAPKILTIGDSIGFFQTLAFANTLLTSWGFAPQWIGTVETAATVPANDTTGPLGESRPSWSAYEEFLGHNLAFGNTPGGVLPVGQEAAYRAMTRDQRRGYNPFLNPTLNSGAQTDIVTIGGTQYRFDLRFYLNRLGLADPTIVPFNLGMNDLLHNGASPTAIANFAAALPQMLTEIRRALPTARIILWSTTVPNAPTANSWAAGAWGAIRRKIVEEVEARRATDTNIHLCSAWAHQSADAGWGLAGSAAGPDGVISSTVSELVHPADIARLQHAEALAAAIANLA